MFIFKCNRIDCYHSRANSGIDRRIILREKEYPRVILTFRIERKILKELRSESKLKGESLNVLINQLLKSYVDYHKPPGKAGNIFFPKGALVTRPSLIKTNFIKTNYLIF